MRFKEHAFDFGREKKDPGAYVRVHVANASCIHGHTYVGIHVSLELNNVCLHSVCVYVRTFVCNAQMFVFPCVSSIAV
jgi:hypothetical protein